VFVEGDQLALQEGADGLSLLVPRTLSMRAWITG
jgi:hypothetical protein